MYTIDPTIIKNSHELVMYSRSIILIFFICIFIIGLLLILINFYKKCKKFSINNLINYFLIFFASFFIQSVYISDLEIYPDEVIYLSCSITLSNDYSWVFNNLYSIPILSFLIWSVWINLFPYLSSLVVCRTVSIVFNGFTIIFIHKITKRLLDNKIANLSVLFLIFSPFLMSINSFLLLESIALFFITITIF